VWSAFDFPGGKTGMHALNSSVSMALANRSRSKRNKSDPATKVKNGE
jgi:hypothetical protein